MNKNKELIHNQLTDELRCRKMEASASACANFYQEIKRDISLQSETGFKDILMGIYMTK